jgi:hypothetical protein
VATLVGQSLSLLQDWTRRRTGSANLAEELSEATAELQCPCGCRRARAVDGIRGRKATSDGISPAAVRGPIREHVRAAAAWAREGLSPNDFLVCVTCLLSTQGSRAGTGAQRREGNLGRQTRKDK